MRILFLTCNTGHGHNAAAEAVADVARQNGDSCEFADALSFFSPLLSRIICLAHVNICRKAPRLWATAYRQSDKAARKKRSKRKKSALARLLKPGRAGLKKYLKAHPCDAILCTHPFAAIMVTELLGKEELKGVRCAFLATDYTCAPTQNDQALPICCIADEVLVDDFVFCGIDRERLFVTGIPVKDTFRTAPSRAEARSALGLNESAVSIVLSCGSTGCGPLLELSESLRAILPQNGLLTIFCGTNKKLLKQLNRHPHPQVLPLGFNSDTPLWLASADLFITKPGGLSITEAVNLGTPMLLMNVLGACETPNFRLFLEKGYAEGTEDVKRVPVLAQELLADDARREKLVAAQRRDFSRPAAVNIWRLLSGTDGKI